VTYETDSSTVTLALDAAGNLLRRVERNGDAFSYMYDALNRVVTASCAPGEGSSTARWGLGYSYDANGNRTALYAAPYVYGSATYGDAIYGGSPTWTVPVDPGYDALNRMLAWRDRLGNVVDMAYDVEGRRTEVAFPSVRRPSPHPMTSSAASSPSTPPRA
jgi:YD repeat-containing protein